LVLKSKAKGKIQMKLSNFTTLGICASLLVGGTIAGTSVANAQGPSTTPPPRHGKGGKFEKHPEMLMAHKRLEAAKDALQKGAHDLAGHREKALDLTDRAIAEVREAIKSDLH
jgi:hypothetical protein